MDLSSRTDMIMFLFCSYVYALTEWGTEKKRKNTTKGRERVNLIPKHIFIINSILTVCRFLDWEGKHKIYSVFLEKCNKYFR